MAYCRISYGKDYCKDATVEIATNDNVKIPEAAINKALMITMNYLIENMETEEHESAE
jgi:hypothetical protein